MSWPSADPKRLQLIDRVIAVLRTIDAGTDHYFYTPHEVTKRMIHYREATGYPTYMVHTDSATETPQTLSDHGYDEVVAISVKGIVDAEDGDAVTKLERCVRDIRYALDQDSRGTDSDSIGAVSADGHIVFDSLETDNGYLGLEGFGYFDQRILVRMTGDWGEL